jgi:uncharacterized protein YbaR (Trm112 family)
MHLHLTDRLTCPRCGPEFGLVLLARDVRNRRVIHGLLGCSNCREQYPVEEGFGDLRSPPRKPLQAGSPPGAAAAEGEDSALAHEDLPLRLAAMMGVTEGPGTILMVGPLAAHAGSVARLLAGVEVVAMDPGLLHAQEEEGVSRMVGRPGLPFFSGTFLGVTVSGTVSESMVLDSIRVLNPMGRVAFHQPSEETMILLEGQKLEILLREGGVIVARKGPELVTLRGI